MSIGQYLRMLWARRWVFLLVLLLVGGAGVGYQLMQPKQYVADVSMLVETRPDPILGVMAPSMLQPAFVATQVDIIRSERVASRVVKALGVDKSENAVKGWLDETGGKTPIERYYGELLLSGLAVEPSRGTNFINLSFTAPDPKFAAAAANAFAQSYLDVAVDLRVEPARQYAAWFDEQSKVLRADLEAAQARLSKYQQEKGITDERLEQETSRLTMLMTQVASAQAEQAEASSRQQTSGGEASPDVQQSSAVQGLKSQLATAQTRLTEISNIVGSNHPQRLALESQITELKRQISAEMQRVSGSTFAASRASARKLGELQSLVEQQKARVLALRGSRDDIQVLVRDVENAQRAYENARSRLSQLSLESQTNQTNVRVMSPAIEPSEPSMAKALKRLGIAVAGALLAAVAAALGLEFIDRRVRAPEDLMAMEGVPVLGVLGLPGSKQPVFRQLSYGAGPAVPTLPHAGAT
ncbi:MAG TPA: chain length determinant protein EpsF [Methylibium sp.]|nr:chain length determinant protein EpsF [Methylibium sp.]